MLILSQTISQYLNNVYVDFLVCHSKFPVIMPDVNSMLMAKFPDEIVAFQGFVQSTSIDSSYIGSVKKYKETQKLSIACFGN